MRPFRLQFTIAHILAVVAISALMCFLLSAGLWPVIVVIAIVAPGFFLDRAKGGAGILGAMLAGILGFVGYGIACYVYLYSHGDASRLDIRLGSLLTWLGLLGLACGAIFGLCAWPICLLAGRLNRAVPRPVSKPEGSQLETRGPTVRYGYVDRGLQHPRAGGRRP
jgi:hypothetical protein